MRKRLVLIGVMLIGFACYAADFSVSALTGYQGGLGFKVSATVARFAQGFPVAFEFGVGHTRLNPGNPELARRVFINEATNGTPEKTGYMWNLGFNFLFPVHPLGIQDAYLYLGVRRTFFTGSFTYIGGNEAFDVTTNPWGCGAGLRAIFPMGKNIGLIMSAGIDYYPDASLTGHDTSYGPDGEMVNQEKDYTYKDADTAIDQPKFQGVLMVGVTVGL